MSHYAIIKRQRYWIKPDWHFKLLDMYGFRLNKIKYESKKDDYPYSTVYENIIIETESKGLLIDYWEGNIYQDILGVGEKLVINDEIFTIESVEKHVDGKVTYHVDALYEKTQDYDYLLKKCEARFEENKKKEVKEHNPSVQNDKQNKKSWFQRIFG